MFQCFDPKDTSEQDLKLTERTEDETQQLTISPGETCREQLIGTSVEVGLSLS